MKLNLKIVTPEKVFFDGEVERVISRGVMGDFAVLPKHTPFVTELVIGRTILRVDNEERYVALSGGYIHVGNDETVIIAEACEYASEIDVRRAEEAKQRAQKRINDVQKDTDMRRAEIALKKAMNRIEVANSKK